MDGFPSGQRGQTVNLLSMTSKVRILPHPVIILILLKLLQPNKNINNAFGFMIFVRKLQPSKNINNAFGFMIFVRKLQPSKNASNIFRFMFFVNID